MLQIFLPPLNTAICKILGPWNFLRVQYLFDLDHLGQPANVIRRKWKTIILRIEWFVWRYMLYVRHSYLGHLGDLVDLGCLYKEESRKDVSV